MLTAISMFITDSLGVLHGFTFSAGAIGVVILNKTSAQVIVGTKVEFVVDGINESFKNRK